MGEERKIDHLIQRRFLRPVDGQGGDLDSVFAKVTEVDYPDGKVKSIDVTVQLIIAGDRIYLGDYYHEPDGRSVLDMKNTADVLLDIADTLQQAGREIYDLAERVNRGLPTAED